MKPTPAQAVGGAMATASAIAGLFALRSALEGDRGLALDVGLAVLAVVATRIASKRATRVRSRRAWRSQSLAPLVWALGAVLLLLDAPETLSMLARFSAVVCAASAWWLTSRSDNPWSRVRLMVDGGLAVGSVFVVGWDHGLREAWNGAGAGFSGAFALAIPLSSLAVALFGVGVMLTEMRGRHRLMPVLFVMGLVVIAFSDVAYACGGTPLWAVGWALTIAGTLAYRGTSARNEVVSTQWRFAYAPYVLGAPAAIVLAFDREDGRIAEAEGIAGGLMVVLLLVRQHVTLIENSVLVRRLELTERLLRHQATHDHLTGLAGRVLLWERLEAAATAALSNPIPVCLLFVDLDDFKAVNDMHGHAAGYHVLVETARRLVSVTAEHGDSALAVRMSGDEFAVLLTGNAAQDGEKMAHRILSELAHPISVNGFNLTVGASVGVASTTSDDLNPSSLLRAADVAMYGIKHHGKGGVEVADGRASA